MYTREISNHQNASYENRLKIGASLLADRTAQFTRLCVADVMTRDLITLTPRNSFAEIVSLMAKHPFRHFLVTESPRRLLGVISDRDVLLALARTTNWQATYAGDLMSSNIITVQPDTKLSLAADTMLEKHINCLPVVDDKGDLCGILTSFDLLKRCRDLQERLEKDSQLAASVAKNLIAAGVELVEKLKR